VQAFASRAVLDTTPQIVRDVLLSHPFGTTSEALGHAVLRKHLPQSVPPHGIADSIAINALDPVGNGCVIMAPVRSMITIPRSERALWERVTAHFAAGHRLRRGLVGVRDMDGADAVLDPTGRVLHASGDARLPAARAALERAVTNVDRARSGRSKTALAALDLWSALVAGQWSIVDRIDTDGRRLFVAWRNDPAVPLQRTMSERELQCASYAALGHSNKMIAYSLGLTTSTVATHLANAQRKLGVRSRVELIELVRALRWSTPPSISQHEVGDLVFATIGVEAPEGLARLSQAERVIAQHVLRGLSDKQIARARGTSPRTIANQLRRIFEEFGVNTRAELAASLARKPE
jgi:DNA-binding CsgD family transcriptional regulator